MNILVVDDEPSIVQLLNSYLTRNGHVVKTAATGTAALAFLKDPPSAFQLAVVDLTLPDISGLEVAIELLRHSSVNVILASGYDIDAKLVPTNFQARVRLLHKPFMPKAILDAFPALT